MIELNQPDDMLLLPHLGGYCLLSKTIMNLDLQWPLNEEQSKRLLEFCLSSGVDAFSAVFLCGSQMETGWMDEVIKSFVPFNLGIRQLERTVVYGSQSQFMPAECWSFNNQTIPLILDACDGSLSSYEIGSFPEDWTFYRNGELFLGFVSHERFAVGPACRRWPGSSRAAI